MKLIRFPKGEDEVLIDPEKVSCIERKIKSYRKDLQPPIVYVSFIWASDRVEFHSKDAERVWDYFVKTFKIWIKR